MNIERTKRLWDKAEEYSNGLPPEDRSIERTVGFYDCLCRKENRGEQQQPVDPDEWNDVFSRQPANKNLIKSYIEELKSKYFLIPKQ